MTSNFATEYCIALFSTETGAREAHDSFKVEMDEKDGRIKETAVLHKDAEGKYHVYEPGDTGGGKGAAVGAVIGALIGAVTGPGAIITSAAGAMIGGLGAKLSDTGFNNKDLKNMAESLKPGTSALLAVVADSYVGEFADKMRAIQAQVIVDALNPMITEQLEAEHAAFLATLTGAAVDGLGTTDAHQLKQRVERQKTADHGVSTQANLKGAAPEDPF